MEKSKEHDKEKLISDKSSSSESQAFTHSLEKIINENKVSAAFLLIGLTFLGVGAFYIRFKDLNADQDIVVVEETSDEEIESKSIFVEISGAVEKPGVYEFEKGSRVEELLVRSGGLSEEADKSWVERFVNRAAILSDGQKLYIPKADEQLSNPSANSEALYQTDTSVLGGQGSTIVNINTATQKELEELWGIGPVYAQKIIEQRPYSSVEELLEKGVIKSNVYERNKDLMSIY